MDKVHSVTTSQVQSIIRQDNPTAESNLIATVTRDGETIVVSRYDDDVWEFWPYFEQSNVERSRKRISWSTLPQAFVPAIKAVLFRYWSVGLPGRAPPRAVSVISTFYMLKVFVEWLIKRGVMQLAEVRALHTMAFVADCRDRGVTPKGQRHLYRSVEILYALRLDSGDRLTCHPWPRATAASLSGLVGVASEGQAQTPIIPDDILLRLFSFAEEQIVGASERLDERDSGRRDSFRDPELLLIRDAAFFIAGLLSGMRCEELVGIRVSPIRREALNDETIYWLKSVEHKTSYGEGEWMVPEIVSRCLTVLERWGVPFRAQIEKHILELQRQLPGAIDGGDRSALLQRLEELTADRRRLFLGSNWGQVSAMSSGAWRKRMEHFATTAGVKWKLLPHQLRRTFVVSCAHHALGDLVFLKHQLKHRSMDMTALYAHNPRQDESLFDEILDATRATKVAMIEHWLNPESLLAGGASAAIRPHQLESVSLRRALAEDTAEKIMIRATGHGWCLAQDDGCGGRGLWEKTRCVDCDNGLIEERDIAVWRGIHEQQRELLAIVDQLGPGAARRIQRDFDHATKVLQDLGVPIEPSADQNGR